MNEKTLIKTMSLPYGQEWAWYADANMVVLSPRLDAAGREHALSEVQAYWRRSCLCVVGGDDEPTIRTAVLPRSQIRNIVESL